MRRIILVLTFIFIEQASVYAQNGRAGVFLLEGQVSAYYFEPGRKILKKEKQVKIEGVLETVHVKAFDDNGLIYRSISNSKGEFKTKLKVGKIYRVEFSKQGYAKSVLTVDLTNIPYEISTQGIRFSSAELSLNSYVAKDTLQYNEPFGTLFFNTKENFVDFLPAKAKSRKGLFGSHTSNNTAAELMLHDVEKNKALLAKRYKTVNGKKVEIAQYELFDTTGFDEAPVKRQVPRASDRMMDLLPFDSMEIEIIRKQLIIDKLNAVTKEDSIIIKEREALLDVASENLVNAKHVIQYQDQQITTQKRLLYLAIACVLFLILFLFSLYKLYKEKKRTNVLLNEKNQKITDSITYAKQIQTALLKSEEHVSHHLPPHFILFLPKDIVSGDFYWAIEKQNYLYVAAADCTGHGVAGAMLTMLGTSFLNEITAHEKIPKPSEILGLLRDRFIKELNQTGKSGDNKDGMDISLFRLNLSTNELMWAGANNPLWIFAEENTQPTFENALEPTIQKKGMQLFELHGDKQPIAYYKKMKEFTNHTVQLKKGNFLYFFTDGFADQFGGKDGKKYMVKNLKNKFFSLLDEPMDVQKKELMQEFDNWKGSQKQIDDVCVIGFKI